MSYNGTESYEPRNKRRLSFLLVVDAIEDQDQLWNLAQDALQVGCQRIHALTSLGRRCSSVSENQSADGSRCRCSFLQKVASGDAFSRLDYGVRRPDVFEHCLDNRRFAGAMKPMDYDGGRSGE
jgi:hypothetical protein